MKKYIFIWIALCLTMTVCAQVDRSKAPKSGPAPKVQIGEYKSFTLDNGLKVLVVENNKIPQISINLNTIYDPIVEKDKAGYISMAGSLWGKGTEKRNAKQLNEEVDFLGANLNTGSYGVYCNGLSKYTDQLMEIFSDVILHPTFPQDEFDKLMLQTKSNLQTSATMPEHIMENISNVTMFGGRHPYGEVVTEATLDNITLADCKSFYQNSIHPNNSILVIVGDITLDKAKQLTNKYLGSWQKGNAPAFKYDIPQQPKGRVVVFSNKDAAPQASISVAYPVNYQPNSPNATAITIMNQILGGGDFQAKLFQNLRESKGYTYGAYSSLSSDELAGSGKFNASSEVKSSIADSALMEILKEMQNMVKSNFSQEDIDRTKKTMAGSFSRSLESPSTIANFAYRIEKFGLPKDYYTTYLERLSKINREDVIAAVKEYIHPDNAYLFVVGDRSLKPKLAALASNGPITELDRNGVPVKESAGVAPDMTPEKIVASYLQAIGGAAKIKALKDLSMTSEIAIQGMTLTNTNKYLIALEKPLFMLEVAMGGNVMQKMIFDGEKGIISGAAGSQTLEGDKAEMLKIQAYPVLEAEYATLGITPTIEGIEKVDGKDAYKLKVSIGDAITYSFYDVESGLKVKSVGVENGATQEVVFEDYQPAASGILYPRVSKTNMQGMPIEIKVTEIKENSGLKAEDFK